MSTDSGERRGYVAAVASETRGTVLLALLANLGIAAAKAVGGVLTGSASLMSEAAHSVADTMNEVFLLTSLGRSTRPADETHPFGYGKERFFWSLLAAVGIFVSGAGFSVYQGLTAVLGTSREHPSTRDFVIIYVVLGFAGVLEGSSLAKAVRQVRREAAQARRSVVRFVLRSPDPTVKTVASEDSVAVIGVIVAAAGTALHQITGNEVWDGVASFVIAALLAYIAYVLGRDTKELLIGEAADPRVRLVAYDTLVSHPEVVAVKEMLTMQLGPENVLVAARVQFDEDSTVRQVTDVCTEIEEQMRERVPELSQVFLDPTDVGPEESRSTSRRLERTIDEVRELDGQEAVDNMPGLRQLRSRTGRRLQRSGPRG